jgi:hypothetical protein
MTPSRQLWRSLICTSTLLLALAGRESYAADLYRWQDDKGVSHFSDKPPKGVKAERIKQKPVRAISIDTEAPPAVEDPDAKRCSDEKDRLKSLQAGGRIFMEERDGTRRELSADEIKQEVAFSTRAMERFCKSGKKTSE